jgi:hypothetical protein
MEKCPLCDGSGEIDDFVPPDPIMKWFEEHQEELYRDYPNKHVAITPDGVVAAHESLLELDKMLKAKGVRDSALVHFINPPPQAQ